VSAETLSAIALAAILLLAAALRLAGLDRLSLWADEGYSVALSSLSAREIVAGTAAAQHPPLYYLFLAGWIHLAGRSVLAVRLFSALAGWLTVPLLYRVGRRFGPGVGLAAAGLLAVSPAHIWYSQEARMYALLVLLGTASTWLAWRWWTEDRVRSWPWSLLYGLVTAAALYTHNFALFLIAAQNLAALFLGWLPRREGRWLLALRWLAAQAIWFVAFLPWLPNLLFQTTSHRMTWIPPVDWSAVRNTWLYLLYGGAWQGRWVDLAGALLGLGLVALALCPGRRRQAPPSGAGSRPEVGWLGLWFWATSLIIVAVARRLLIYQDKQMLIVLPPLLLLLALGLQRLRRWPLRAAGYLAILALLAGPLLWQYTGAQKQDWRALAGYVDARAQAGDLIYFNPHATRPTFDYYSRSASPRAGYPPGYTLVTGGWAGELASPAAVSDQWDPLVQQFSRVWLVEFYPGFWDPQGLIEATLQQHYRLVETLEFADVTLKLFARGDGP